MTRVSLACLCAFAFGLAPAGAQTAPSSSPAPSAAAAPSPEAAKIAAAMTKIQSFRIQISSTNGMGGTITVLVPAKRSKAVVAMGQMVAETVTSDAKTYSRVNGGDWHLVDMPSVAGFAAASGLNPFIDPSKFHILADRVENGTTLGVYEMIPPMPPGTPASMAATPMRCTYDKTTYLPRTCTFQTMTQTFEGWNDPANVVDVPVVASPKP
jgi:hypothetical protein